MKAALREKSTVGFSNMSFDELVMVNGGSGNSAPTSPYYTQPDNRAWSAETARDIPAGDPGPQNQVVGTIATGAGIVAGGLGYGFAATVLGLAGLILKR